MNGKNHQDMASGLQQQPLFALNTGVRAAEAAKPGEMNPYQFREILAQQKIKLITWRELARASNQNDLFQREGLRTEALQSQL